MHSFLISLLVLILVIFYAAHKFLHPNKKLVDLYERIALKRNGQVIRPQWGGQPIVTIPYQKNELTIYTVGSGSYGRSLTTIAAEITLTRPFKFQIYRTSSTDLVSKKLMGVQELELNNKLFDEAFVVKTSHEGLLRMFLTFDIQELILRCKDYNPIFEFGDNKFALTLSGVIGREEVLDALIDTAVKLLNKLQEVG